MQACMIIYNIYFSMTSQHHTECHCKKCWVVSTQSWVKNGQTQMLG